MWGACAKDLEENKPKNRSRIRGCPGVICNEFGLTICTSVHTVLQCCRNSLFMRTVQFAGEAEHEEITLHAV